MCVHQVRAGPATLTRRCVSPRPPPPYSPFPPNLRFFARALSQVKAFKLNAERNNGRAAMLGVTGCLVHELLGVDALYPTGGLGGDAPPAIFS